MEFGQLFGKISEDHGIITVESAELDEQPSGQVWLAYQGSCQHWLVVYSSIDCFPVGCTADYPDHASQLVNLKSLALKQPSWTCVLSNEEISSAIEVAQCSVPHQVLQGLLNRTASKELVILFGPPCAGKTTFGKATASVGYSSRVPLILDEVIDQFSRTLFQKLVRARPNARTDPFEREALVAESVLLYSSFMEVAGQVLHGSVGNLIEGAIHEGLGIVTEATGAALNGVQTLITAVRSAGYRVRAYFLRTPADVIRRRLATRLDNELEQETMLGGRRFGSFVEQISATAARNWTEIASLCDEATDVPHCRPSPPHLLRGMASDENGVLQIDWVDDDACQSVWLTFRRDTSHWLVVHSTVEAVPLGSTANYPENVAEILHLSEWAVYPPTWVPMLSDAEICEGVAEAERRIPALVDELCAGKSAPRELVILVGPPGAGKTSLGRARQDVHYEASAQLVYNDVIRELSKELFRKIVEGRPRARVDPFEKEAFLVESLQLHSRFMRVGDQAVWRGSTSVLRQALEMGVGMVTETTGAHINGIRSLVAQVKEHGYRVRALYATTPLSVAKRRVEARFCKELDLGTMLGGRRFDAFLDRLAAQASENWKKLEALCAPGDWLDLDPSQVEDRPSEDRPAEDRPALRRGASLFHTGLGRVGVLVSNDASLDLPYKVAFSDGSTQWCGASSVEKAVIEPGDIEETPLEMQSMSYTRATSSKVTSYSRSYTRTASRRLDRQASATGSVLEDSDDELSPDLRKRFIEMMGGDEAPLSKALDALNVDKGYVMSFDVDKATTAMSFAWENDMIDLFPVDKEDVTPDLWLELKDIFADDSDLSGHLVQSVPDECFIGQGQFGKVWRAKHRKTGEYFAVKNIESSSASQGQVALRERQIAKRMLANPHPCIVGLFEVRFFEDANLYSLVMEFCTGGNLKDQIQKAHDQKPVGQEYQPPQQGLHWIGQVFMAIEHLHLKTNTLSRDLKPENVVTTDDGRAKLIDFGVGRLSTREQRGSWTFGMPPGSPGYVAPEVLHGEPQGAKVDLYSFGVLIWVLMSGGLLGESGPMPPNSIDKMKTPHDYRALFHDWLLLKERLENQAVKPWGSSAPVPIKDRRLKKLILWLVARHPKDRPNHREIRKHEAVQHLALPQRSFGAPGLSSWQQSFGFRG